MAEMVLSLGLVLNADVSLLYGRQIWHMVIPVKVNFNRLGKKYNLGSLEIMH